jgi:5-methyltetrahydropteroyltriglutamate--homocysteine methyltransferase
MRAEAAAHADHLFRRLGDNLDRPPSSCPSPACTSTWFARRNSWTPCWKRRPRGLVLSLGVIDGRNVWRADLEAMLDRLEPVVARRAIACLAPSCSLLHTPIDLELETASTEVKSWLAFAVQKIEELAVLGRALNEGREAERHRPEDRRLDWPPPPPRRLAAVHDAAVAARLAAVTAGHGPAPSRSRNARRAARPA